MISTLTRRLASRALRPPIPSLHRPLSTTSSDLPYHIIMPMPALSPTMSSGTISTWNVAEGQSFSAGDSIAEIETDKATMDFEAQDDGIVAKILVESGKGEVEVGVPVLVVVEEEDDVGAFKDFVVAEEVKKEVVVEEAVPPVAVEAPVAAAPVPPPQPVASAPAAPAPEPVAAAVAVPVVAETTVPPLSPSWGNLARVRSPLANTLSKSQKKYVELYGSTGQVPL